MTRFLYGIALLVASMLFGLVLGEIGLRAVHFSAPIWYRPDPQVGWALRPGAKGWFTSEGHAFVRVSGAGFRDGLHSIAKPQGVYRVAVLGDSYAEAMQVDFQSTFWWKLQEKLEKCIPGGRRVEVMNFGVSGYGTAQEDLVLESTAERYQPDLVLLAFTNGNDLRNNSAELEPEKDRPFYRVAGEGLRLDDSFVRSRKFAERSAPWLARMRAASERFRIVQLVHAAKNTLVAWRSAGEAHAAAARAPLDRARAPLDMPGLEPGTDVTVFAPPRDAAWKDAWTVTERTIARMNDFAEDHHARFALTTVTHAAQVNPDPRVRENLQDALGVKDLFYIERRMQALGKREGFQVIPLAPEMQAKANAEHVYFHGFRNVGMGIGHWNENGHGEAAEIIARGLCERGFSR
jgi:hypothetical protein